MFLTMQFTQKGHIHIYYEEISKHSELPAYPAPAATDLILITIEDTGIGITNENLKIIPGDFRQAEEQDNRRFEGIGIGLSLAKSIIEQHNGDIWITSIIDKGIRIFITMPKAHDSLI